MTNFEKIKSMSVDELSDLLHDTTRGLAINLFGDWVCNQKTEIVKFLESE